MSHTAISVEGGTITLQTTCSECNTRKDIKVDQSAYMAWKNGALIQRAMPRLSEDDRELLISGICGPCFDKTFADVE